MSDRDSSCVRATSRLAAAGFLALLIAHAAFAQSSSIYGSIVGTVTDPSGAAVAQATVTAVNVGTNISSTAQTDASGFYRIDRLVAGTYSVTAEQAGFTAFTRKGIALTEAQSIRVEAQLQLGSTSERVEIQAETPLLQTESPQISTTLPFSERKYLPTVAPSFFNTLTLSPGAVSSSPNYYVSFNGSTGTQYDYAVDGQSFRDPLAGHNAFIGYFNEWQQDQTISSANNPAEYSQPVVANASTKSGTNCMAAGFGITHREGCRDAAPFLPSGRPA